MLSKRAFLVLKGNKGGSLLAACSPGASLRCRKVTFLMTAILVFSSPSLVPLLAAFISWVIWAGGERGQGPRDRTALHPSTPFPQGHCPQHLPQSSIHKKTALANWEDEEEEGREGRKLSTKGVGLPHLCPLHGDAVACHQLASRHRQSVSMQWKQRGGRGEGHERIQPTAAGFGMHPCKRKKGRLPFTPETATFLVQVAKIPVQTGRKLPT